MAICESCFSTAVEDDIASGQVVCTECGTVAKTSMYVYESTSNYQGGPSISSGPRNLISIRMRSGQDKTSKCLKKALGQLRDLSKHFKMGEDTLGEAERMLKSALDLDEFRSLHADRKTILAGCCIYAALRNRGCDIQLSNVANKLPLKRGPKMAFIYRKLKCAFPEEFLGVRAPGTSQVISAFLVDTGLKDCACDLAPCMRQILKLAETELVSTGVHYKPLLCAVSYLAWRSQPTNMLQKLTLAKFCTVYKVPKCKLAGRRLNELTNLLVKLSKGLPWLEGDEVTKKNVFPHVASILEHSHLLAKEELGDQNLDLWPRKKYLKGNLKTAPADMEELVVSDSLELTNEDLPETEMHHYVFTEDEVKRRRDAMAYFNM